MAYMITAELPLGTYRGHSPDGSVEAVPSVARLHAALLSAAGFGPRACLHDGGAVPTDADNAALRWLENHPPDEISVPPLQVNSSPAVAYRDDGTLAPKKGGINKLGKAAGWAVAVSGQFTWSWSETPPPEIVAALDALCPDVSHLGTTESPVRLRTSTGPAEATHRLDPDAGLFAGAGDDLDLPGPGRTDELAEHHRAGRALPSPAKDRSRTAEDSEATPAPRHATHAGRYAPAIRQSRATPWPRVLVLHLDRTVPGREKVRWAVAAHRGLIRLIGDGAPAVLTGVFPPGTPRSANRIALQILDPGHPADRFGHEHSTLAIMIPDDMEATDLATVMAAIRAMDVIRGPRGRVLRPQLGRASSGSDFWSPPAPGTVRVWRTDPVAIPDTRGGTGWGFVHAALLSLGFVWQGTPHLTRAIGRGRERDERLVEAANAAGVAVLDARPVFTSSVQDYVHHVHPDAVVRPYRALLALGDLGGPSALQAIGQSRHLGGGLLVPVDLPEGSVLRDLLGADR